jgi:hypothetical protein
VVRELLAARSAHGLLPFGSDAREFTRPVREVTLALELAFDDLGRGAIDGLRKEGATPAESQQQCVTFNRGQHDSFGWFGFRVAAKSSNARMAARATSTSRL